MAHDDLEVSPATPESKLAEATISAMVFAPPAVDADEEVQRLLRERLAVLEELVEFRSAAYKAGFVDLKTLFEAGHDVAQAKVELAATRDERIEAMQRLIDYVKSIEEQARAEFEAERAMKVDMLMATAFRLKAEAELTREKAAMK